VKHFILNFFLIPGELLTLANVFKHDFYTHISRYLGDRYIYYDHVGCDTTQVVSASSVVRVGTSPETLVPTFHPAALKSE
jgi:hypothetical protein